MILKDKNSSKIIRSASGEILTKSDALIDLRSTYGVTKNVSNEVEKVRLYNSPLLLKASTGSEPIENGNGFAFDTDKLESGAIPFNHNGEFSFGFWCKFSEFTNASSGFIFQLGDSTDYVNMSAKITLSIKSFALCDIILSPSSLGIDMLADTWYHVYAGAVGGYISSFFNGYFVSRSVNSSVDVIGKLHVGNTYNNIRALKNSNIDDLKISPFAKYAYGSTDTPPGIGTQIFTPPKRSSE